MLGNGRKVKKQEEAHITLKMEMNMMVDLCLFNLFRILVRR